MTSINQHLLTVTEAANHLGVARQWVYMLVNNGSLRCISKSPMRLSFDEVQRYKDLMYIDKHYDEGEWCKVDEAAQISNLSQSKLRSYISKGMVESRKTKYRYLIRRDSLIPLIQ